MLYTALDLEVKNPLDDFISYDIGATKVEVCTIDLAKSLNTKSFTYDVIGQQLHGA